ncbi:hypothetical protein BDW74DRAFT_175696 [Aspergillus multicolor]|uniref:uncharacterized protein n=1 Tax=Aspergillus multicolor TaxID=41759 RepID=UPI003CCD2B4C
MSLSLPLGRLKQSWDRITRRDMERLRDLSNRLIVAEYASKERKTDVEELFGMTGQEALENPGIFAFWRHLEMEFNRLTENQEQHPTDFAWVERHLGEPKPIIWYRTVHQLLDSFEDKLKTDPLLDKLNHELRNASHTTEDKSMICHNVSDIGGYGTNLQKPRVKTPFFLELQT